MEQNSSIAVVFGTGELLEAILYDIDAHTLLTAAPRVCRQWHHVISNSLPLQQKLFLVPSERNGELSTEEISQQKNPFLKTAFPPWFSSLTSQAADAADPAPPVTFHHPIYTAGAQPLYSTFLNLPLFKAGVKTTPNPFLHPSASWRRMLTSQPPTRTLAICQLGGWTSIAGSSPAARITHLPDGLRMGELYDMTLLHGMKSHGSRFIVSWPHDTEAGDEEYQRLATFFRVNVGGILPRKLEFSLATAWQEKPDLVIALARGEGVAPPVKNLSKFWARCGAEMIREDVVGAWDDAQRGMMDKARLMMGTSPLHLAAE